MRFSVIWRTGLSWCGGILLTLVMLIPGLIVLAIDPFKQRLVTPMVRFWARSITRLCFLPVRIEGLERLEGVGSAVFVANHQSMMDVFLALGFIPRRLNFLAKKQTLWIPLIGQLMLMLGHIPVDRANPRKSLRSVQKCIEAVDDDRSILIFPEGTRTGDGEMLPFKSGSLRIPLRTGAPIVPVTILGTFNVMPKKSFAVNPYPVMLHIGEPIDTAGLEQKQWKSFIGGLEDSIRATKDRLEAEHPECAPRAG